jgi:SAM-dependent methyltransferase
MVETGLCHSLEAFDLAEGAIRIAAERAAAQGLDINFHVADANTIKLPRRQYDFICASHSLHHIENLEHLFEQVAGALTPDGLFFADDYIGPSRMQWSDTQLTLMNQLLRCLPERKRISRVNGGTVKRLIERVPLENFLRIDPSEGVRAADIVPVARQFLDVEVVPIGMGIIFEVLFGIIHNFEVGNDDDEALLDLACLVNQVTEEAGLIDPCFACLVGRSKGSPGFDLRTI